MYVCVCVCAYVLLCLFGIEYYYFCTLHLFVKYVTLQYEFMCNILVYYITNVQVTLIYIT